MNKTIDNQNIRYTVKKTYPYPLGVYVTEGGIRVCVETAADDFGFALWVDDQPEPVKIPFDESLRVGNCYAAQIDVTLSGDVTYLFYSGENYLQDPYAKAMKGKATWGKDNQNKCRLNICEFDWKSDKNPALTMEERIFYMLHVRGYSMKAFGKSDFAGTFAGLTKKLDYMKELGVTSLLLMPAYDFNEVMNNGIEKKQRSIFEDIQTYTIDFEALKQNDKGKLNYWGYSERNGYYRPKAAFAKGEQPEQEVKELVRDAHDRNMEVFMQFYFPATVSTRMILDVLLFWRLEYHIDGFYLIGPSIPVEDVLKDPALANVPLLLENADDNLLSTRKNCALVESSFMYDMRSFLKGDGNCLGAVTQHIRRQFPKSGHVHFMAKQDTMRLMDMVSYQEKHNEDNGENNTDGSDYNCSWNCGVEGKTRKKQILSLRMKQMKNAMSLLLLSQGTPLLYGGDEFGHTQLGNNNPYCQDNAINHLDWKDLDKNKELYQFTEELLKLRKAYPILRGGAEFKGTDYLACGFPDISFHSEEAWKTQIGGGNHLLGVLYANKYANKEDGSLLYVAYNMHWEKHKMALPRTTKGQKWECILSSDGVLPEEEKGTVVIPERTVLIFRTI